MSSTEPRVAILLGTYNGERYLRLQMDSFIRQSYKNWVLYISDDGSKDQTRAILNEYQKIHGADKIILFEGPCKGCAANYASLISRADIDESYALYADQDDVWLDDKIERTMEFLTAQDQSQAALYMAASIHIDHNGNIIGASALRPRTPSFKNALLQNIAGGNTFGLNKAALDIIRATKDAAVLYPDWWIYIAVSASGGALYYDPKACMLYRQHETNMIGANRGLAAKLWRVKELFFGSYNVLIWQNVTALKTYPFLWTNESNKLITQCEALRAPSRLTRLKAWFSLGLYRQSVFEDIAMLIRILI